MSFVVLGLIFSNKVVFAMYLENFSLIFLAPLGEFSPSQFWLYSHFTLKIVRGVCFHFSLLVNILSFSRSLVR